jgi:hypothetical protein
MLNSGGRLRVSHASMQPKTGSAVSGSGGGRQCSGAELGWVMNTLWGVPSSQPNRILHVLRPFVLASAYIFNVPHAVGACMSLHQPLY